MALSGQLFRVRNGGCLRISHENGPSSLNEINGRRIRREHCFA
jgi:hypothetical protein